LSDPAHENHDIDEPANQQPIAILDSMPVKNKMYVFLYGVNPFSPPTPMRFIITTALTAIFFIGITILVSQSPYSGPLTISFGSALALLFTVASISGALHRQAFGQPAGESKSLKTFAHLVLLISTVSIIWGIVYVAGNEFIPILQDFCQESPVCDGVDFETLVDTLRWTLIAMLVFCSFLTWFFIREAVYLGNINSLKKFIPKFAACRTRHPNAPSLHVDGEIVKLFAIYLFCGAFVFGLCFPIGLAIIASAFIMGIAAGLGKLSGVNMDEGKIMTIYFILCLTAFGLISGLWWCKNPSPAGFDPTYVTVTCVASVEFLYYLLIFFLEFLGSAY